MVIIVASEVYFVRILDGWGGGAKFGSPMSLVSYLFFRTVGACSPDACLLACFTWKRVKTPFASHAALLLLLVLTTTMHGGSSVS